MLWGVKLALAVPLSLFAFATAQPATCGGNPDATTWYTNAIDNTFPKALADYTAAVDAFPSANATPEDIDVFRDCENAPMAVATLFNSTSKVQALFPQLSKIMNAVSRFEPQVLAQGRGGHWAIYQTLDLLSYNMWYVFTKYVRELALGKPSALEDAFMKYYNAVEATRAQYYRREYGNPPSRP
ncbi:hypothetical protein H1R20_g15748, partial [Candolleomyces eurysporus]